MLTPISTKIEEFEKIGEGRVRFVATRQEVRDFISTALQQRDEEWRELIESTKVDLTDNGMQHMKMYNQALNEIITKSKEI